MTAFTRHRRMTTPLRYTRITGWALPLAFGGLVFALVGVWAGAVS